MEKKRQYSWVFHFRSKLILSYLLLATIPVLVIVYLSYIYSIQSIREHTVTNITGTLKQIRDNVLYKAENIIRISDKVYYNRELQADMNTVYDFYGAYDYMIPQHKLDNDITSTLLLSPHPIRLALYVKNHTIPQMYTTFEEKNPLDGKWKYDVYHMEKLQKENWYSRLNLKVMDSVWTQVGTDTSYDNLSLIRPLIDLQNLSQYGVLHITVSKLDLFEAIDYKKVGEKSCLLVVSEKNELIFGSAMDNKILGNWNKNVSDYMILSEQVPKTNWTIKAIIPESSLERDAKKVSGMAVRICITSFVLLGIISLMVTRIFSSRIRKIVSSLDAFKEGEFNQRIDIPGKDEFAMISDSFNDMAATIDDLIKKVYVSNLQKKEAELEALQAQINPHFLYNTLSSISRLSQLGDVDKLHEMVKGLARFYRLTLNNGKTIISIHDELKQVITYIDIQKIKYGDRLSVSYDIDETLLSHTTVKLILQPIVENALKHAWYGKTLHLRIMAHVEGGEAVFNIIDNGVGMKPETIEHILQNNRDFSGLGMNNVDKRIKLQYGKQYGISIFSRLGIGTRVQIMIPASGMDISIYTKG
jgi:two-component system, sensor histidine kinase YesM